MEKEGSVLDVFISFSDLISFKKETAIWCHYNSNTYFDLLNVIYSWEVKKQ